MSTLHQVSHNWATRPADERFVSLYHLRDHFAAQRAQSRATVVSNRQIEIVPETDHKGLRVVGPNGAAYAPTNWAFGQLAGLADAPAGYLRTLPSDIAADCINYGLKYKREIEDVGVLLYKNGDSVLRAATGPKYGRIWNHDIASTLAERFGDGLTGQWRQPGEFGKAVTITKDNCTLYAGDRDMFVFLCDEENRIELPGRRAGRMGTFARGFFVWNSEVGSSKFGIATFLFDYTCCNRIVWGVEGFSEMTLRHTAGAPDRFAEELQPALLQYSQGSTAGIVEGIQLARRQRVDAELDGWLAQRFGKRLVEPLKAIHMAEEERPIETVWDAVTAATAHARNLPWQDDRVALERVAGSLMPQPE